MTFEEFEAEFRKQVREYGGHVPQEAVDMAEQGWELAFEAGAASRDAEVAELVAALDALLHTPAGHSTERNIAISQAENTLAKVRKA